MVRPGLSQGIRPCRGAARYHPYHTMLHRRSPHSTDKRCDASIGDFASGGPPRPVLAAEVTCEKLTITPALLELRVKADFSEKPFQIRIFACVTWLPTISSNSAKCWS